MATTHRSDERRRTELAELGRTLRTAREALGLSGRRLAVRAGIHHASLARIELGEQRPGPETLQLLAVALELDEADLFALADYRLPERLPSLPAYLRAKYRMPEEAAAQLNEYFDHLRNKYAIEDENQGTNLPARPEAKN